MLRALSSARPSMRQRFLPSTELGEWTTASIAMGRGTDIQAAKQRFVSHTPSAYCIAPFTAFLGFEVNEGEYKVMGMAPLRDATLRRQSHGSSLRLDDDGALCAQHGVFLASTIPHDKTYNRQVCGTVRRATRSGDARSSLQSSGYPVVLRAKTREPTTNWAS